MIEGFSHRGVWFVPEAENKQVTGTIYFEPNTEPRLELTGTLAQRTNEDRELNLILGYTINGKPITLYNCYESRRAMSIPGIEVSEYSPMYVFIGYHFKTVEELQFKVMKGQFKNLAQWVDVSGFQEVDTNHETHETNIKYKLPNPIDFTLDDGTKGSLSFLSSSPFHKHIQRAEVEQKTQVHLELPKKVRFDEALSKLLLFQNFLTLATFETAYPTSIIAVVTNEDDSEDFTRVEVLYKPGFTSKMNSETSRQMFLFTYKDIKETFPEVIKKWISIHDKLDPVTGLLLDSFHHDSLFNENKFLNIIHALETFHRRLRKNEVLTKEDHKKKVQALVAFVPDEEKKWLLEKLSFTNEPSLHQRLVELLDEAWNDALSKIIEEKDKFIKQTKDSRNYYTHYDPEGEKKALKGTDLFYLTQRLRFVLIILLLKEIGIDKATIDRVVLSRIQFYRSLFHTGTQ